GWIHRPGWTMGIRQSVRSPRWPKHWWNPPMAWHPNIRIWLEVLMEDAIRWLGLRDIRMIMMGSWRWLRVLISRKLQQHNYGEHSSGIAWPPARSFIRP